MSLKELIRPHREKMIATDFSGIMELATDTDWDVVESQLNPGELELFSNIFITGGATDRSATQEEKDLAESFGTKLGL
jgi:hypothetical protein